VKLLPVGSGLPGHPVEGPTYHYRSRRTGYAPLLKRIKEIAETRVRCGYGRIHVPLC